MTKHVSDNGYNVSVTVSDSSDKTQVIYLPSKRSRVMNLLNLYDGKTEFFVIPGFNTYSEINCKGLD